MRLNEQCEPYWLRIERRFVGSKRLSYQDRANLNQVSDICMRRRITNRPLFDAFARSGVKIVRKNHYHRGPRHTITRITLFRFAASTQATDTQNALIFHINVNPDNNQKKLVYLHY